MARWHVYAEQLVATVEAPDLRQATDEGIRLFGGRFLRIQSAASAEADGRRFPERFERRQQQ